MGLIIMAIMRFSMVAVDTVHEAILDGYFLCLGIVVMLTQMEYRLIVTNFRFLNYHWGKFLLSSFIATMSFGTGFKNENVAWAQYMVTLYFVMVATLFALLSIVDRQRDLDQWQLDKIDILQNSPLFNVMEVEDLIDAEKAQKQ